MREIAIVTGASGYVGRELCEQLVQSGAEVRAIARSERSVAGLPASIRFYRGDVTDCASMRPLFWDTGDAAVTVYHAAALISVERHDKETLRVNVGGTKNLLSLCCEFSPKKLVFLSSTDALHPQKGEVVSEPEFYYTENMGSDYARSKAEASRLVIDAVNETGLDATLILPSCVLGPGDYKSGFTSTLISMYLGGMPPISIPGGYDFVDVRDVAALTIAAAKKGGRGESYLATGEYATVTEVFNILGELTGRKPVKMTLPTFSLRAAAAVASPYYLLTDKPSVFTQNAIDLLTAGTRFSHEKATKELGYSPRGIREIVTDTVTFVRAHPEIYKL